MSGIQLKNQNQEAGTIVNVSATVPPHAPTAAAVIARVGALGTGKAHIVVAVAVAGTKGNSADFKQVVRLRDAGFDGTGTTVITNDAVIADASLAAEPAQGAIVQGLMLASAAPVIKGKIIDIHYSESGTIGTATRATFTVLEVILEPAQHVDARFNQ